MHCYFFCIVVYWVGGPWVCHSYHIYSEKKSYTALKDIMSENWGTSTKKHPVQNVISGVGKVRFSCHKIWTIQVNQRPLPGLELATFCPETCLPVGSLVGFGRCRRELAQWPSIPQEIMMATEVGGWFNSHFLGGDIDPYDSRWGFSQMNPFFRKSKQQEKREKSTSYSESFLSTWCVDKDFFTVQKRYGKSM